MKKICVIIHRWGANPNDDWYQSLGKKLEEQGYKVLIPEMPNTDSPNLEEWVVTLQTLLPDPNGQTLLIGHSIGVLTILHYLNQLKSGQRVGQVITVAGWFHLENLEGPEEEKIARSWLEVPLDFEKVKKSTKKLIAIFSDDDPFVPIAEVNMFKEKLGATIHIVKDRAHVTDKNDDEIILNVINKV